MTDIFDELSAASEPHPDKDGNVRRGGILWVNKPAANSLSMTIHAMRIQDGLLTQNVPCENCGQSHEAVTFVEAEDEGKPPPTYVNDPELDEVKSELSHLYLTYESISESLGPEHAGIFDEFCDIVKSEGLPFLSVPGYQRRKS
jgi:hypothetical protein